MGSNAPDRRGDGLRSVIDERVRVAAQGAILGDAIGRANANADAQRIADGIGIQNIRRGVARAEIGSLGADITIAVGGYAPLSTPLALEMWLSGRPLRVEVSGIWSIGGSASQSVDVLLRGESVTGKGNGNGLAYSATGGLLSFHGREIVMAPAAGRARLEVVTKAGTNPGILYVQGENYVCLTAVEE